MKSKITLSWVIGLSALLINLHAAAQCTNPTQNSDIARGTVFVDDNADGQ
jgi:hypothetical protein